MFDMQNTLNDLRKIPSNRAADWVLLNYPIENPDFWIGLELISHLSWKRSDQVRLAQHYLKRIPFANGKPYEIFSSIMSLKRFIEIIRGNIPTDKESKDLLLYHLLPILQKVAKSSEDHELVQAFKTTLSRP